MKQDELHLCEICFKMTRHSICPDMKQEIQDKIRQICTYHGDEGTSGYSLSNDQFKELFDLFSQREKEVREKYKGETKRIAYQQGYKEAQAMVKKELREKIQANTSGAFDSEYGLVISIEDILYLLDGKNNEETQKI